MSSREPLEECPPEEQRIAVFTSTQTVHGCWYVFFIFILLEGVGSKHPHWYKYTKSVEPYLCLFST